MDGQLWPQVLSGLLLCFFGWALYWGTIHLAGGLIGAALGVALCTVVLQLGAAGGGTVEEWWWIPMLGGVIGLVLGVWLIRGLHKLFFFLLGAALGMAIGIAAQQPLGEQVPFFVEEPMAGQAILLVGGALIFGLLMILGARWVVILSTALAGALLVALAIEDPLGLLLVPVLGGFSFFLQTGLLRRSSRRRSRDIKD